jgi:hypothetical protein
MFDDIDDMGGGLSMSIHILSGGKSSKGFPYDDAEGIESKTNYYALSSRERYERQNPELFEAMNNLNIAGRELQEDRGHIQTTSGPYFPHFY